MNIPWEIDVDFFLKQHKTASKSTQTKSKNKKIHKKADYLEDKQNSSLPILDENIMYISVKEYAMRIMRSAEYVYQKLRAGKIEGAYKADAKNGTWRIPVKIRKEI